MRNVGRDNMNAFPPPSRARCHHSERDWHSQHGTAVRPDPDAPRRTWGNGEQGMHNSDRHNSLNSPHHTLH